MTLRPVQNLWSHATLPVYLIKVKSNFATTPRPIRVLMSIESTNSKGEMDLFLDRRRRDANRSPIDVSDTEFFSVQLFITGSLFLQKTNASLMFTES